jgi:AcrR family transcriptional regulator
MNTRRDDEEGTVGGESARDRIIRVARDLINEKGDFDLLMRDLAARARVSMRTPYQYFGSKSAIITEILHLDQAQYRPLLRSAKNDELAETFFENLQIGIEFVRARQPFYRALFRATQAYSGGRETEPARENQRNLTAWCRRASRLGLLEAHVLPEIAAEALTNIVAAEYRYWANSDFDIRLAGLRIGFGYAAILAGLGTESFAKQMREKAAEYQRAIQDYEDPAGIEAAGLFPATRAPPEPPGDD